MSKQITNGILIIDVKKAVETMPSLRYEDREPSYLQRLTKGLLLGPRRIEEVDFPGVIVTMITMERGES